MVQKITTEITAHTANIAICRKINNCAIWAMIAMFSEGKGV